MENNILKWLQNWYKSNCNDEWEHIAQRINISTIDNPGWRVDIDLSDSELEKIHVEYTLIDNSEEDWYTYKLENGKFNGNGDPDKLEIILNKFREIVEGKYFK
jgi:hypothetical protein